jgi:hypothetical protein
MLFLGNEEKGCLFSLCFIVVDWLNAAHHECFQDPKISIMIQQLQLETNAFLDYTWKNEELCYKGHLYLNKKNLNLNPQFSLNSMHFQ